MLKIKNIETFVPLYITNECDSFCSICNMRKSNHHLKRIKPDKQKILQQLRFIYENEKISAVCILTGEYFCSDRRKENLSIVAWTINTALNIGYKKVFFNIGSLFDEEIHYLYEEFYGDERIVLSLFQETYDHVCYNKFFGDRSVENPKADYNRRLTTPERFLKTGFKNVDIGILLGLRSSESDVKALIRHANNLMKNASDVYISIPRIRGTKMPFEINDDDFFDIVQTISNECYNHKIIVTTRESNEMIGKLLPFISVISPGCSDVYPYNDSGVIENKLSTSQFQVSEIRPRPSDVLRSFENIQIEYFDKNQ